MTHEKEAIVGPLLRGLSRAGGRTARSMGAAAAKIKPSVQPLKVQPPATLLPAGKSITQATNPISNAAPKAVPKINPYQPPPVVNQTGGPGGPGLNTRLLSQLRDRPSRNTLIDPPQSRYYDLQKRYMAEQSARKNQRYDGILDPDRLVGPGYDETRSLIRSIGREDIPGFPVNSIARTLTRRRKGLQKLRNRAGAGGLLTASMAPAVDQEVAERKGTESYTSKALRELLSHVF